MAFAGAFSRVFAPIFGGEGEELPWWNPDGATPDGPGGSCVGAYQAKGAASYAASLVNLANPGTNDLTETNGAVPWALATGWQFTAVAMQALLTGVTPIIANYSMLIQFLSVPPAGGTWYLCGTSGTSRFYLGPIWGGGGVRYGQGGAIIVAPGLTDGNIGIANQQAYRNGLPDGAIASLAGVVYQVAIGAQCANAAGGVLNWVTGNVLAGAIYSSALTAPQMLARATEMAAL